MDELQEKHATREDWLQEATISFHKFFHKRGLDIPVNVRLSCGFPHGSRGEGSIKSQTWPASASKDKTIEIFISPALDDPESVMRHLIPELIHAAVGPEKKHNKEYQMACSALGLGGNAVDPVVRPQSSILEEAHRIIKKCGAYPHAKIDWSYRKKQSTRLVKAWCGECDYTVRLTRKWIHIAVPTCPNPGCPCKGQTMETDY